MPILRTLTTQAIVVTVVVAVLVSCHVQPPPAAPVAAAPQHGRGTLVGTSHPTIDISAHELIKENVCVTTTGRAWDNVLVFRNSNVRLSLPGSIETQQFDSTVESGPDRATLNVAWVIPGQVLWVKWKSIPVGNGAYCTEAHILVLVEGQKVTELTRQAFFASGGTGAHGCFRQSASFVADTSVPHMPRIVRRVSCYYGGQVQGPQPLALKNEDDVINWFIAYRFYEDVGFGLQDGRLVDFPRAFYSLQLDLSAPLNIERPNKPFRETVPVEEVAEFLLSYIHPRIGQPRGSGSVTAEQREHMVADLRNQNGLEQDGSSLSGIVKVPWQGPVVFPPMSPNDDSWPFRDAKTGMSSGDTILNCGRLESRDLA